MGLAAKQRRATSLGVISTLALAPALLTASSAFVPAGSAKDTRAAGEASWSVSRSGARTAMLEHIDPESIGLEKVASRKGGVVVSSPKGSRVWTASALSDTGVPQAAMRAYRRAAATLRRTDPACQIPWTLLAAIGRVESDHGRYGGSVLGNDGVSRPLIIGIPLNGVGPVAAIRDTDGGRFDKDTVWDRAVGPMQFIPSTWATSKRDGDGDGIASPNDIDDAALAAAYYLCSGSGSVLGEAGMAAAVFRYNHDDYYVDLVMAFERGYRTGTFVLPSPPAPDDDATPKKRKKRAQAKADGDRPRKKKSTSTGPGGTGTQTSTGGTTSGGSGTTPKPEPTSTPKPEPTSTPKPEPTSTPKPEPTSTPKPTPNPSPSPSPTSSPEPSPVTRVGAFRLCQPTRYCLDDLLLDIGQLSATDERAAADYDMDGVRETNGQEVAGLLSLGEPVTMVLVPRSSGKAGIFQINGHSLG